VAAIIQRLLDYPIQNERWKYHRRRFRAALLTYANALGLSKEQTIASLATLAIREAVRTPMPPIVFDGTSTDLDPASLEGWARHLRRLINDAVTRDLLGPDWRRASPNDRVLQRPIDQRPIDRAEATVREAVARLLTHPDNTPLELEVMHAFLQTDGDIRLIAERLHRTPEAIRQVIYRLRKRRAG
jgi:hypothetical protein